VDLRDISAARYTTPSRSRAPRHGHEASTVTQRTTTISFVYHFTFAYLHPAIISRLELVPFGLDGPSHGQLVSIHPSIHFEVAVLTSSIACRACLLLYTYYVDTVECSGVRYPRELLLAYMLICLPY
jgi:hypothetical protein